MERTFVDIGKYRNVRASMKISTNSLSEKSVSRCQLLTPIISLFPKFFRLNTIFRVNSRMFRMTSCTGTLIFGALVLRMSYMVKNKNPVGGRTNRPTRQHPHNQYPHNQLLDESMTNVDEDSSNYDSQYS